MPYAHAASVFLVCAADEKQQEYVIHNLFQHFDPTKIIDCKQQIVSARVLPVSMHYSMV